MDTLGSTLSAERGPRAGTSPPASLSVAFMADAPLEIPSRHVLDVDEVLVGRGSGRAGLRSGSGGHSLLTLRFDDPRMSSTHARLVREGDTWSLVDQGSKNGSRLNGQGTEKAALSDGDILELGSTFLVFRRCAEGASDVTADEATAPLGMATLHGALEKAIGRLARVARSEISVILLGESGVGKEVFARAIHEASSRAGPLLAINCGALPATLVEAELFGCKKGAFSGAVSDRVGLVRSADGGTLLLDEIGDLPLSSQAALLRVLQEREVMPVGATRAVPVDVRVIAATHRDLAGLAAAGTFREDLLARLSGFTLKLPPLRERIEDLGMLIRALLKRLAPARAEHVTFTRRAARALVSHAWPKNVRELEKCLEAALVLAGDAALDLEHLPEALVGSSAPATPALPTAPPASRPEDEERRRDLKRLLAANRGNLTAVAREMGKARFQVQRWIKRYALRPGDYR